MKKFVSILLCLVMVLGLLPMAAFAAGEDVIVLVEADKKEGLKPGDTITYTVALAPVTTMAAADFTLVIPEGLELGTVTAGAALPQMQGNGFIEVDGYINFSCYGGMNSYTSAEKTVLGTFTCTVKADTKGDQVFVFDTEYPPAFGGLNNQTYTFALNADTVNVPKTSYTPKTLTLSYTGTLAIENKNFTGTAAATISGTDTDDDALPASELAKVTYEVDKTWAAVAADGTVSIKDVAAAEAGDITVTAKLGTFTTTATVTVTKAAPAVDSVTAAASNNTTALIPTDADSKDYTYAVDVKDQYGAAMSESVTWTAGALPTGVTFDATTATLTVAKTAESGKVTLTATVGGKSVEIEVNVTNISFAGVDEGVKATDGVYGDKLSDMVKITASKITATAGTTVTGTYTLENANDVPAAGTVDYKVVFNGGAYENVTVAEGTVTVAPKEIVVTAKDVSERVRADVADVEAQYDYTSTELVGDDELSGTAAYTVYALNEDGTVSSQVVALTESVMEEPAEYAIVVSGLSVPNANYTLTFSDAGRLEIRKKTIGEPSGSTPPATNPNDQKDPSGEKLAFDDVTEDDWFYAAVTYVADNGLMNGMSEKIFAPNTTTTRAMIATILWRHAGSPEPRARIADFPDVDPEAGAWYINAVRWCAEQEIVTGYDNGNFGPDDVITREQLVTMLYRYAGSPEVDENVGMVDYNDADTVGDWAANAMRWAVQTGIINGRAGGLLVPQGMTTRAEVATVMQRFVVLEK